LAPYLDQGATQHAQLQATNNVAWACPTWARIVGKKSVYTYRTRAGIGLNGNLGLPDTTRSWNTDWTFPSSLTARDVKWREVANLGQRVLLGDSQWSGIDARYYSGVPKWYASVMDPTRHGGRANYAFCDGRVTTLLPSGGTAYSYLDPAQYNP
jgi:prepilin-type processing-associated H-X9-DG protein